MSSHSFLHQTFQNSGLTVVELEQVVDAYERVEIRRGDYLLQEGQQADDLYVVEDGLLRAFAVDLKGNEVTTNFYEPGQIAIEVASFFLRVPTREHVQALTDCVCWRINFNQFQELFHGMERFREYGRSRLVQKLFQLKRKSLSMITDSATDRYAVLLQERPYVLQHAALKHVASYIGVTDTSLSRIRKELTDSK